MTGKERAALRAVANGIDPIQQIGHNGVTDEVVRNVDLALKARELIKLTVLETSPQSAREAAEKLSSLTAADVIQVIGRRLVLYRYNPELHLK